MYIAEKNRKSQFKQEVVTYGVETITPENVNETIFTQSKNLFTK